MVPANDSQRIVGESKVSVQFLTSPLFKKTYAEKTQAVPGLAAKFTDFVNAKTNNPIQQFGKNDTPMISAGPMGRAVPGIKHAHLTQDLSVFYTMGGRNPTMFYLYGIFSHKDSGTGNSPNVKAQKSLGQQMANQQFTN
jgi:hypothetical protein